MKILFVTQCKPSPNKGGIARATVSVASLLAGRGHKVYVAFSKWSHEPSLPFFSGELDLSGLSIEEAARAVGEYVDENGIDAVVTQGQLDLQPRIQGNLPVGVGLVFCLHNRPGCWVCDVGFDALISPYWGRRSLAEKFKRLVKVISYPVYKPLSVVEMGRRSRRAYEASHVTVLLSRGFSERFLQFAKVKNGEKLAFIPNPLTFEAMPSVDYSRKEKTVLIVARLEEMQKRISRVLEIWKAVKVDPVSKGWELRIVGYGPSEGAYRNKVAREGIPDVRFLGQMAPGEEYAQASIFLMTSEFEGWGITLTEAQQHGVVPVAFDTYESLQDIVDDGETGFIVPRGNNAAYAERVLLLMRDPDMRERMGRAAAESTLRFSDDIIAEKWEEALKRAISAARGI